MGFFWISWTKALAGLTRRNSLWTRFCVRDTEVPPESIPENYQSKIYFCQVGFMSSEKTNLIERDTPVVTYFLFKCVFLDWHSIIHLPVQLFDRKLAFSSNEQCGKVVDNWTYTLSFNMLIKAFKRQVDHRLFKQLE